MKKLFILFFIAFTSLAFTYEPSYVTPQIDTYNQAKELFKNKKYQKAYDLFYKLFEKNLEDPNINFYLGRSAYMLQHFELAIAAYERVLMSDPKSVRSNLEIAKCYFELKDYKESKKIFLETLSDQMPTNVQQNIRMYLKALDSKTKKNFISGSVVLGLNYDSNIYSRANDDIFTIPGIIDNITNQPIKTTNSTPEASGYAHQQAVSLNHLYKFDNEINFKNNFVFFAKTIVEHHNRDIMLAQYSPAVSVTYNHNKILVDYALLFSKIWLGSKSTMTYYGINPRLTYVFDAYNILSSSFKYQEKNIVTNTSHITELDFSLRRIQSSKTTFLFYTRLAAERKVSDGLQNIDSDLINVAFSTSYCFTPLLSITPKLQYYMKWYKDEDVFYVKKQEDKELQFLLNSTYSISKSSLFSMDYSYMNHISNIPSWEFNKHSLTANIILLF
ncbi:tetratricopeptide repeat protein [Sulfurimonas sp.]|jgi:tetratricopeptide (TPR) repeat protein|uniref:tetratricopeptide repeat protein n=1 Tax=Sulfurimonas sp. TaxID=2022749 RepID=UPI0025E2BDE3|nr:tetratricopeptide repeat protein [Sulfurimonas sp.]MBT5935619.1 tetratricopeptide repeat protein [Sulfurimonas sp.]